MLSFYLSQDFHLSINDSSESTDGFKMEVHSEILSKYDQVIACVCFDKKQTKQVPLSFMNGVSQEIFISDIYEYELSKSIDIYCICCDNIPPYDNVSSNTVEIEIPPKKDAVLISKEFNENGDYAASDDNADGYSEVTVDVPDESKDILNSLIDRTITTITSDVTSIGNYAFYNCTALTEVSFPEVTSIGDNAFYNCTALTEASFPNVTSIGNYAFQNCAALTEVSFPSVTSIGDYAFYNCTTLTEVSFPNVTSIGDYAFYNCTTLTEVSFPNVTSIESSAFNSCTSLTEASFPNVTSIGGSAFQGCTALTEVSFPNVTSIGGYAFYNCTALTEASFPNVTSIESSAFNSCTSLTEASFPNVTSIGGSAFQGCTALTEVSFPNVTSIGKNAFKICSKLQYFDMSEVDKPPIINTNTFYGTTCIFLFRDQTQLDKYASATNWSTLTNRFQIKGATT